MQEQEEWVHMQDAAKFFGMSVSKISRMASQGKIKSRQNPRDERSKLVDIVELKKLFGVTDELSDENGTSDTPQT